MNIIYNDTKKDIDDILLTTEKPGRYIGQEFNIHKKDLSKVKTSIVLAFPDLYEIGMSYYGLQILYHILNKEKDIAAERVYAPWPDFENSLRKNLIPLYSLESHIPVRYFDTIGFSITYELNYTNVLNMLDLAGVAIWSKDRKQNDPIVIAGGSSTYNPEPMAPFIDLFVVGDAEEVIVPIVKFIGEKRNKNIPRIEILKDLVNNYKGLYVPVMYNISINLGGLNAPPKPKFASIPNRVKSNRVPNLSKEFYPTNPIVPLVEITHNRLTVEIMRGCTQGCRFCQAGMIYRPVREREPSDVFHQIEKTLPVTGYDTVSLLSLSTSDYSGIDKLSSQLQEIIRERYLSVSLPSLRPNSFTESTADISQLTKKSGLTFAPEAGTERLRKVINKHFTEDELFQSTEIALKYGWRVFKLYFMIGLPEETEDDLDAIHNLCAKILKIGRGSLSLNITLSSFIPKPFTPFQWERQNSPREIQAKLDMVKPQLRSLRKIKIMARDPKYSELECILSRGDRKIADVIFEAWKQGAKFDSWRDYFSSAIWERAFKRCGVEPLQYISSLQEDSDLPWEVVDPRVSKEFLLSEKKKSRDYVETPDCRKGCYNCGVCGRDSLKMRIVKKREGADIEKVHQIDEDKELNPVVRYRIKYKKGDAAKFTSHLDTIRIFTFALRRANLDLVYTQGFNKKPKMSTGIPLPLGYTSDEEYIEIFLKKTVSNLYQKINENLPDGFKAMDAIKIPIKSPSIFNLIQQAKYIIKFKSKLPIDVDSRIEGILSEQRLIVEREGKNKVRRIDLRKFISNIYRRESEVYFVLKIDQGQTAKINELLKLLSLEDFPHQVHRLKVYLDNTV